MSDIGSRLKQLRGDASRDSYAPTLGVSKNTIVNYETGKSAPDSTFLTNVLVVHSNINPTWLLTGEGPMTKPEVTEPRASEGYKKGEKTSESINIDGNGSPIIPQWNNPDPGIFDFVPMAKATLSAGGGAFVLSENIEGYYAFRNSWLNSVATSKRNLVLMRVTGESMAPTIQSRDTVMIDVGRREIKEGEIFAIRVDQTVMIKRLSYRLNNKVLIISDNRKEFEPYEADIADVHILGQVIFFSRVLIQE